MKKHNKLKRDIKTQHQQSSNAFYCPNTIHKELFQEKKCTLLQARDKIIPNKYRESQIV